jgi:hypothetical protein
LFADHRLLGGWIDVAGGVGVVQREVVTESQGTALEMHHMAEVMGFEGRCGIVGRHDQLADDLDGGALATPGGDGRHRHQIGALLLCQFPHEKLDLGIVHPGQIRRRPFRVSGQLDDLGGEFLLDRLLFSQRPDEGGNRGRIGGVVRFQGELAVGTKC